MKVTVLEGDYIVRSRQRMTKITGALVKKGWNIVKIDEGKEDISEKFNIASLFEQNELYLSENPTKLTKRDLDWIKNNSDDFDANFLIWHKGVLPKKIKNALPKNTNYEKFELPKVIFKLLESLYPGNGKTSLMLLHELIKNDPVEFAFIMMARHFRDLYWVKVSPSNIPYPSWRVGKLEGQARRFELEQLSKIIDRLAKIDMKIKTSGGNLQSELDILIISNLK